MRLLFELDTKDHNLNSARLIRPSVRAIIIQSGRIAMIHSLKYNYYKFPGGGIENSENHLLALLREVREEAGLMVFYQEDPKTASQELDPYESEDYSYCKGKHILHKKSPMPRHRRLCRASMRLSI